MGVQEICGGYSQIGSKQKASFKGKLCMMTILMLTFVVITILLITYNGSTNRSNDIQLNISNSSKMNVKSDNDGHTISCLDCCDPNIDFDSWLKQSPQNNEYKLLQSHYITRHGDRTQVYPQLCWDSPQAIFLCTQESMKTVTIGDNSLYGFIIAPIENTNVLTGDCLLGELTPKGYEQLKSHGNDIRNRYQTYYNIIPDKLHHKNLDDILSNIRLRADVSPRVQQSVMAFFMGLYPNYNSLSYQIKIPIYVEDDNYEIITDARVNVCPELENIVDDRQQTQEWTDFSINIARPINDTIAELFNSPSAGFFDAFDCGTAHLCHDFMVPYNLTQELYQDAQSAAVYMHLYQGSYPDYKIATKYHIGPFLKLIYHRFKIMIEKQEGIKNDYNDQSISKLYVYGGHDTGPIIPLLSAFQYDLTKWVSYAATIVLELFQNKNKEYFVLISYNGEPIKIPVCNYDNTEYNLCEWNLFEQWIFEVTPTMQECPNMKIEAYLTQNV